jgi:hypothetical protein
MDNLKLDQAGGTPLSMNRGGIARLGYESGGVTLPSQGSEMSQMQNGSTTSITNYYSNIN